MKLYYETCIVIGTGQFAFNCAQYLHEIYRLDMVLEYGNYAQSRLEYLSKKNGFKYSKLFNKIECDKLMKDIVGSRKRTLIVSASNIYIFPVFITECPYIKIVNYHPALLAKHLGRNTEAWSIWERDSMSGVTWHEVTSEIDHGNILAEKDIVLDEKVTSIRLMIKQYQLGLELFKSFIGRIMENQSIENRYVETYGKRHYSYEKPNDGILNLDWDGSRISAFLRSMDYGNLNVMGRAYAVKNGMKYSWDSYKISNSIPMDYTGGRYDKVLQKDNIWFILSNFHKLDDVKES